MLTQKQITLLIAENYNLGRFYLALNACDEEGVNHFTLFPKVLKQTRKEIKGVQEELALWESANTVNKKCIIEKIFEMHTDTLQDEIIKEKEVIIKLSKLIHELTTLSSENKLDSEHVSETSIMTELLEEIGDRNTTVSTFKKAIQTNMNYNLEKETVDYEADLRKELAELQIKEQNHIKSVQTMKDRKKWLAKTFNIDNEEVKAIIDKYAKPN